MLTGKAPSMNESKHLFGIVFDAMHLQQCEFYKQATDSIEGREDLGEYECNNNVVNYDDFYGQGVVGERNRF